jgi:predicted lipoprotein with Yx(FWY)xxD motif
MRSTRLQLAGFAVLLIAIVATVAAALGAQSTLILKSSKNAHLNKTIVVDIKGKTLYRLSGETATKFKCTSAACFAVWSPLTVTSKSTKLHAAKGVHGTLTMVKRDGVKGFQVLLGGKPLYHFSGDTSHGDANGNGITSFGGTWNVLGATAAKSSPTSPTSTTKSNPAPPPMYPGY